MKMFALLGGKMKRRLPLLIVMVFTLALVSCATVTPTPTVAPSPTPSPTNTPGPTTTPTREIHLVGGGMTPDPNAWIYVALGDSEAWGFPEYYADYIAEDNNVRVQLYNSWRGGLSTQGLLNMLEIDTTLRTFLSQARVITFEANPSDYLGFYCIDRSTPYDNSPESWALYKADLNAIIDILFELRQGQPTLIIAQNFYNPIYSLYRAHDDFEKCQAFWVSFNEAISEAAAMQGIPVADVFSAFNGADHLADARDTGYISSDGEHVNAAGSIAIADVFRALGYEMIVP
jgi:lysophospholipase L1-like esterase